MIKVGERLPQAEFIVKTDEGMSKRTTSDVFAGRKVVLFAVPGAFTPTCHMNHLPGFLANADAFKARGVDEMAVVAVNDPHVMKAWADATGATGKITFLADGSGDFTKATGMTLDLVAAGLGERSQRYSMLVEDGVVKVLNIGDAPGKADITGAEALLGAL